MQQKWENVDFSIMWKWGLLLPSCTPQCCPDVFLEQCTGWEKPATGPAGRLCVPAHKRSNPDWLQLLLPINCFFFITAIYFFLNKGDHCLACGMQHGWETCLYSSTGRVPRLHQSVSFILQLVDVALVCQQGVLFEFLKTERNKWDVQWQWIYMGSKNHRAQSQSH